MCPPSHILRDHVPVARKDRSSGHPLTKDSYTATGAGLVQACPVLTGYHTDTSRRALALTWDRADLDKARIVRPGFLTETKQDRSKLASLASRAGLRTGMKEVWRHVPRRSGHVHGSNHPEFHLHHLRHRGVTNLADAGIDRKRSGRSSAIQWWNCSCATARSRLRKLDDPIERVEHASATTLSCLFASSGSRCSAERMVPKPGVEPGYPYGRWYLKPVRLPVPPLRREEWRRDYR